MTAVDDLRAALWSSHRRLTAATSTMSHEQLVAPSYCTAWSTAQVLSHVGSGAEIFGLILDAGLSGAALPDRAAMAKVWDIWNAVPPAEQAQKCEGINAAFLDRVDSADEAALDAVHLQLFGMEVDISQLLAMRLSEHAIHTWDVLVIDDASSVLPADAVALMVGGLERMAARAGKADGSQFDVQITSTHPERVWRLSVSEAVRLTSGDRDEGRQAPNATTLTMPTESLIRLLYGRLDPGHAPASISMSTDAVDLNQLRAVFPGV